MSEEVRRVEVITSVQRRWRWSVAEKIRLVEETLDVHLRPAAEAFAVDRDGPGLAALADHFIVDPDRLAAALGHPLPLRMRARRQAAQATVRARERLGERGAAGSPRAASLATERYKPPGLDRVLA